jgi:hypothetical protein
MSRTAALAGVPGVPETSLSRALLETLPEHDAPAPWSCACDAVLWFGRGGSAATAALPPVLRRRARGLGVVGGMVRYRGTPVGPYDEVFGSVGSHTGLRPWGSVAFMAVDSRASLVAGRTNWALPKTLATFEGDLGSAFTARGDDDVQWQVTVSFRVLAPAVPLVVGGEVRQAFPDGRVGNSRLSVRARVRPAVVTVEVGSEGPLASWLRPGRHLGVLVSDARLSLAAPRFP